MGEKTGIAWTDSTINVWHGCQKVSTGCAACYAEVSTPVRVKRAKGLELWGRDAARVETKGWEASLRKWNRAALASGKVHRVFGQSLSDTFEDYRGGRLTFADGSAARDSLDGLRLDFLTLAAECSALTFQLLTKRPENILRMVPPSWLGKREENRPVTDDDLDAPDGAVVDGWTRSGALWIAPKPQGWPAHVQIGCTVEDQPNAEARIPHVLRVPAAVRFLSVEPQVGPVDLTDLVQRDDGPGEHHYSALDCDVDPGDDGPWGGATISWVIQGGESGPKARPFDLAWARSLRGQCRAAGVAYFLKQLGAAPFGPQPNRHLETWGPLRYRDSHGADESEWPEDLRGCRAFPEARAAR